MGGIIGIDPGSWDRNVSADREQESVPAAVPDDVKPGESTKIRIMKREEVDVADNA